MTDSNHTEGRDAYASACADVAQEPPSVLKVCRMQCTNTIKVLLEATRNSPDLVPKQLIDYLVVRTTDVQQQMPWCTANEIASWMAVQLRERFHTGQLWTIRKVHLLMHQLVWRGSLLLVTHLRSDGAELLDAGQTIEQILRTRQEHASSVRLVAAMVHACAQHGLRDTELDDGKRHGNDDSYNDDNKRSRGGSSHSNGGGDGGGSDVDDRVAVCGASMLAHVRNHIDYLAALQAYRMAYHDLVDLPAMRLIHYKLKRPISFDVVLRALNDTLDLLARTAADDARAGSFCAFALAVVHDRMDVDAHALYTVAVDMLTKLLVKVYEQARTVCLGQRSQPDERTSHSDATAAATATMCDAHGNGGKEKGEGEVVAVDDDDDEGASVASTNAVQHELHVLLSRWSDAVSNFNGTIDALARFCASVQQQCGVSLSVSSMLRTVPVTALRDLHACVHGLHIGAEQDSTPVDAATPTAGGRCDGGVKTDKHPADRDAAVATATSMLLFTVVRSQIASLLQLQPSIDSRLLLAALRELLDEDDVDGCARRGLSGGSSSICTASSTDHDITGLSSCTSDTMHTAVADGLPTVLPSPLFHHKAQPVLPQSQLPVRQQPSSSDDGDAALTATRVLSTRTASELDTGATETVARCGSRDDAAPASQDAESPPPQQQQEQQQLRQCWQLSTTYDDPTCSCKVVRTPHRQDECGSSASKRNGVGDSAVADAHKRIDEGSSKAQQQQQQYGRQHDETSCSREGMSAASRNELSAREPRSGAYILRRSAAALSATTSKARTPTQAATSMAAAAAAGATDGAAGDAVHSHLGETATMSRDNTEVIDVTGELNRKCANALQSLLQSDDVVVVCNETCSCNAMKLADRFQILRDTQLGTGSFGTVYRAWDELKGSYLAAKEIAIDTRKERGVAVREVLKEYTILTELSHPNIVRVVAFMVVNNIGRIFMEWMPSGSLQDVLRRSMRGVLREAVVSRYVHDVLAGLTYLHSRGILHRDVKPANMLLTVDGVVKLTDFGSSFVFVDNRRTLESVSIMGTAPYMAPEAVQGVYSPATDVWALGCSVVELVTGMTPWSDLATGARIDTIPLIYKIGSLNDTTELDRPHTRLIAAGDDGDDESNDGSEDGMTAVTHSTARSATSDGGSTHGKRDDGSKSGVCAEDDVNVAATRPRHRSRAHTDRGPGCNSTVGESDAQHSVDNTTASQRDGDSTLVHVSAELRSFLRRIFVVDRKRRATAEELLEHPFVRKHREL